MRVFWASIGLLFSEKSQEVRSRFRSPLSTVTPDHSSDGNFVRHALHKKDASMLLWPLVARDDRAEAMCATDPGHLETSHTFWQLIEVALPVRLLGSSRFWVCQLVYAGARNQKVFRLSTSQKADVGGQNGPDFYNRSDCRCQRKKSAEVHSHWI